MEATLPRGEDQGLWRQAAQLCLFLVEGSGPRKLSFLICQMDTITPTLQRSRGDQMRPWAQRLAPVGTQQVLTAVVIVLFGLPSAWKPSEAESLVLVSSALHMRQKRNLRRAWPTTASCVQPRDVLGPGEGAPMDSKWLMEAESRRSEGMTPQVLPAKQQATAGPSLRTPLHRALPQAWPRPLVLSRLRDGARSTFINSRSAEGRGRTPH